MTAQYIRDVVKKLPAESPYFQWGFGGQHTFQSSSLAERLDLGLSDPEFGGNLAKAYAASAEPMQTDIGEPALLRSNAFLLNRNPSDVNMAMAFQIVMSDSKSQRYL